MKGSNSQGPDIPPQQEISARLPLRVAACQQDPDSDTLLLSGPGWHLRVSGPWRLTCGNAIEAARDTEVRADMAGRVRALVGAEIVDVQPQSRFNSLDLALVMDDGRVLELFSDYLYDIWLFRIGDVAFEGPLQADGR